MKIKCFLLRLTALFAFALADALGSDCYISNPGCLDPTFNAPNGKVMINTDGSIASSLDLDLASGVAIQADGKLVAAGTTSLPGNIYKFVVVRVNTDGSADSTFGGTGIVTTSFSPAGDRAYAVAIQADGKIVVAGYASVGSAQEVFAVARYLSDGTLDSTFATGGKTTITFGNTKGNPKPGSDTEARSLAIQADGKILVAGFAGNSGALARLNANGSLDTSFGIGGQVTSSVSGAGSAMAIQPDGKIVLGGSITTRKTGLDFALTRYNSNGTLDTTFGSAGIASADFSGFDDRIFALAIDASNKIVAGGYTSSASSSAAHNFAVARFAPNGVLDSTFGNGGKVSTDIFTNWDNCTALAIQSNGKIVAAGYAYTTGLTTGYFTLVRYNTDGTPDSSFGVGGIVTSNLAGGTENYAYGVAIQPDGKIVAVGTANTPDSSAGMYIAMARYFP